MKRRDIGVGDMKSRPDGGYVHRVTTAEVVADRTRSAVASGQVIDSASVGLRGFLVKEMISVIRRSASWESTRPHRLENLTNRCSCPPSGHLERYYPVPAGAGAWILNRGGN